MLIFMFIRGSKWQECSEVLNGKNRTDQRSSGLRLTVLFLVLCEGERGPALREVPA